jgi:hypothetical protein
MRTRYLRGIFWPKKKGNDRTGENQRTGFHAVIAVLLKYKSHRIYGSLLFSQTMLAKKLAQRMKRYVTYGIANRLTTVN